MRKTGSREPLESLEASVVSPCSIAVNTFSIRLGSRRNQRPVHQKIRSITTVSPTIDTSRIGHITGPPRWNLSINQLVPTRPPLGCASAAGATTGDVAAAAVVAGLSAPAGAGLVAAPGAAGCPTAPGCPGAAGCCAAGCCAAGCCAAGCWAAGCPGAAACPGATLVAGACCAAAAGLLGARPAGFVPGAAEDCASEVSARDSDDRQTMSEVFIVEAVIDGWLDLDASFRLSEIREL